jgi:putative transposase
MFLNPERIARVVIIVQAGTLLKFHDALKKRKYRLLYSSGKKGKPGPKGPSREVIDAIVAMKEHNPRFGSPRIAQQMNLAWGWALDMFVVRRILAIHNRP